MATSGYMTFLLAGECKFDASAQERDGGGAIGSVMLDAGLGRYCIQSSDAELLRQLARALLSAAGQADGLAGVAPDPEPHRAMTAAAHQLGGYI